MLASLLPGIRELRAPLAAGYIWLLALWVALETQFPEEREATGLIASWYRLADELSTVGLGFVVSFVAYIVGALSTSLFSSLSGLRGVRAASGWRYLSPMSESADTALARFADRGRVALEGILPTSLGRFLDEHLEGEPVAAARDREPPNHRLRRIARRMRKGRNATDATAPEAPHAEDAEGADAPPPGPGREKPRDFVGEHRTRLALAVTGDLDTIATTRLLGRDQELYSMLDRLRAEAEFRRAIAPPLLFAGIVLAARTPWPWSPLLVVGALALGLGLLVDAAKLQKTARENLLDVLTEGRVKSPTIDELLREARKLTAATVSADAGDAADRVATSIRRAIGSLDDLGAADPVMAAKARQLAGETRALFQELTSRLPPAAVEHAEFAIREVESACDAWVNQAAIDKSARPRAEEHFAQFLRHARQDAGTRTLRPPAGAASDEEKAAANRLAAAIRRTLRRLEALGTSEPSLAYAAQEDAEEARAFLAELTPRLPAAAIAPARAVTEDLVTVADAWVQAIEGHGFDLVHRDRLARAQRKFDEFRQRAGIDALGEPGSAPEDGR